MHAAVSAVFGKVRRRVPSIGRRRMFLLLAFAAVTTAALGVIAGILPVRVERVIERDLRPLSRPATDETAARRANHEALQPVASTPPTELQSLWDRRIIRRANVAIELADVERGIARLAQVVEAAGGYIADTQTHTDDTGTTDGALTAYVPPTRFSETVDALGALGRVTSRRISGQDVSEEFIDLEARVRNLEWHEGQLRSFMTKAQKVADLLSLENELARVRGEIERLTGRMRFLKARTEMATVQVNLTRSPSLAPDGVTRLLQELKGALRDGWYAAFRMTISVVVFVAQISPLIIPTLGAWVLYRRRVGRRALTPPSSGATTS